MTDIKVGDQIKHNGVSGGVVTAVGQQRLLYTHGGDAEYSAYLGDVAKVEPFFEVGKKYRHPYAHHRVHTTKTCLAVLEHKGRKWAVLGYDSGDAIACDEQEFKQMNEVTE